MKKIVRIAPAIVCSAFPKKVTRRAYVDNGYAVLKGQNDVIGKGATMTNQFDEFGNLKDEKGNLIMPNVPVENDVKASFEDFGNSIVAAEMNKDGGE